MKFQYTTSAPGKVILSGEHSVVHGCHAVATVVDLRTYATFSSTHPDGLVSFRIKFENAIMSRSWSVSDLRTWRDTVMRAACLKLGSEYTPATISSFFNNEDRVVLDACVDSIAECYDSLLDTSSDSEPARSSVMLKEPFQVFLCYYLLFANYNKCLTVSLESKLPMGSGQGSSASLSAAQSSGFYFLQSSLPMNSDFTFSADQQALVNAWAFQGERLIHGTPSGVDNTCVVYGGVIIYQRVMEEGKLVSHTEFLPSGCIPSNVELVISNTKIPKDTKAMVKKVASLKTSFEDMMSSLFASFDKVAMRIVLATRDYIASQKTSADAAAWFDTVSQLFRVNQGLLEAVGVGHEAISQIVHAGNKLGLVSKLTGAGGGGSVITLVNPVGPDMDKFKAVTAFRQFVEKMGGECITSVMGQKGVTFVHDM